MIAAVLNSPFLFGAPPAPPPGGDPYWENVVLLLHCDGTDGSTTFIDSSNSAHTVTAINSAQISTAQSKFGGASAVFDGVSVTYDYLELSDSDDWHMTGDFTVELFIRPDYAPGFRDIIGQRTSAVTCPFLIAIYDSVLVVSISNNNSSWAGNPAITGPSLSLNTWYHVALTKSGGDWKLWVDGSQSGSTYVNGGALTNSASAFRIGGITGYSVAGNLDEVRITKGVARYTSDFTPPTAAFPDS